MPLSDMTKRMEIIIGTYEEFLLGYKIDIKDSKLVLVQSFADKSHSGSLRCVAVHERWIATGATDDRIFIYDMSTRKQSQIILSHDGTINSLAFTPDGTHLLSAADDGRMVCTRLKTWFTEATWKKAHNGAAVTHVSCHPSGKLALSLGSDLVLRTWNLVKGRVAYKTNLKSRNTLGTMPDCLSWSPTGDYFTLCGQRVVEFWSIQTAEVIRTHKTKSKPVCLSWITDAACLVGLEDGKILWLKVEDDEEDKVVEIAAHNGRVKVMHAFKQNLVTASSSGEVKLWEIIEKKQKLKEIAGTNIGCRPTCLSVLDLEQFEKNHVISSAIEEEVKDVKPSTSKVKAAPRGVVTIEYDNDDLESKKNHDSSVDDDEEDDDEDEGDDTDSDVEDEDDVADSDVEDEDDSETNNVEDSSDDEKVAVDDDEEDPILAENSYSDEKDKIEAKPRKHKLQIQSNQSKKRKLDNMNSKSKFQQQKMNKQKTKK